MKTRAIRLCLLGAAVLLASACSAGVNGMPEPRASSEEDRLAVWEALSVGGQRDRSPDYSGRKPAHLLFTDVSSWAVFLHHSRDDTIVPFAHLAKFAEKLPQASIREVDGRGHQFNHDLSEVAEDIKALEVHSSL